MVCRECQAQFQVDRSNAPTRVVNGKKSLDEDRFNSEYSQQERDKVHSLKAKTKETERKAAESRREMMEKGDTSALKADTKSDYRQI